VRPSDVVPRARAAVRREPPDIIEVIFRDYVTSAQVEDAIDDARRAMAAWPARFVIINTTETTGYDASVRRPGVALLGLLKASGVIGGATVAPSSAVRMIGSAVAFVAGLKLEFVATRPEALTHIDKKRSSSSARPAP
jgi:hypothetical protein